MELVCYQDKEEMCGLDGTAKTKILCASQKNKGITVQCNGSSSLGLLQLCLRCSLRKLANENSAVSLITSAKPRLPPSVQLQS